MESKSEFEELLEILTGGTPSVEEDPLERPGVHYETPLDVLPSLPSALTKYSEALRTTLDNLDSVDDLWVDSLMVYAALPIAAEQFKILRQQGEDPLLNFESSDLEGKSILLSLDSIPPISESLQGASQDFVFI